MSQITPIKNALTHTISIFSLIVVGIIVLSIVFPALIISTVGIHVNDLDPFEIGYNGTIILLGNIIIFTIGIIYFKNKFPNSIQNSISKILQKNPSKKLTLIIIVIILTRDT